MSERASNRRLGFLLGAIVIGLVVEHMTRDRPARTSSVDLSCDAECLVGRQEAKLVVECSAAIERSSARPIRWDKELLVPRFYRSDAPPLGTVVPMRGRSASRVEDDGARTRLTYLCMWDTALEKVAEVQALADN